MKGLSRLRIESPDWLSLKRYKTMTTKELLEDIKKRSIENAKMIEGYRDAHDAESVEYAFRDGQATTMRNEAGWADDMLDVFFPSDNSKESQIEK
jgi:hypothetical protein